MSTPLLTGFYDYRLVTLSVFIAFVAAYAAMDLVERVTVAQGRAQLMWLCGGAVAMGTGIWAMHYIGMEAFHLPVRALYDWPTVLLSLLAAILAFSSYQYLTGRLEAIDREMERADGALIDCLAIHLGRQQLR